MTLEQFLRAQLAAFALQEAGSTGSINCMKAVCYVMANRVRAGWGDWIDVLEQARASGAHHFEMDDAISIRNPALNGLLISIDDMFYGQGEDETRNIVSPAGARPCLFWQNVLNRNVQPWFIENVIRRPDDHPRRAQVGTIILYE